MKRKFASLWQLLAVSACIAGIAEAEVTVVAGSMFTWDGNHGPLVPDGTVSPNSSLEPGAVSFAMDSGHQPAHDIPKLNDGSYGNSFSWIGLVTRDIDVGGGTIVNTTLAGIDFAGTNPINITSFSFGRSNRGDEFADRTTGTYYVQTTATPDPDISTPDGEWSTIGEINISSNSFPDTYRHLYNMDSAVAATGIRIVTPGSGTCIDEIEVYADGSPPQFAPLEEGGAAEVDNLAAGGTAFANDVLGGRAIGSLNDETYGDGSAWVGGSADSFAGISLGDLPVRVSSIAFGRDNTGAETDRALGEYIVQITDVADPDEITVYDDWITIGTVNYSAGDPGDSHLRHRFNIGTRLVTGLRILTPDGAAIDELELYEMAYVPPPPPALTITPAAGFTTTWDGNDGDHFDENPPPDGAVVPDNLALATNGGLPFASSPSPHFPTHDIPKLNDGFYGNSNSHINGPVPSPQFFGIALPGPTALSAIAWGRDNGNGAFDDSFGGSDLCGGQCDDRSVGTYTLQFTTVAEPDELTPDGDWTEVAQFNYTGLLGTDDAPGGFFTEWLRHQYEIGGDGGAPIMATGVRILVSDVLIAIDEIELYGVPEPPEVPRLKVTREGNGGITLSWNSKDGKLYNLRSEADLSAGDPITWPIFDGNEDLVATPPENSVTFPLPADAERFFVVEEFPAPPVSVLSDDFENGVGEWTSGSDGRVGTDWQLGAPSLVGPVAANGGVNCFGTNLSSDYGFDANVWLRSPAIDLTNAAGATLCYSQYTDIESPNPDVFDFGSVSVIDAISNVVLAVIETDITGFTDWEKVTRSIPAAALGNSIKIEFRLRSDGDFDFPGWYIDDVGVTVP